MGQQCLDMEHVNWELKEETQKSEDLSYTKRRETLVI